MKYIILVLLISNATMANNSFLTKTEIKKIETYLDDVCPDTYCGGDLNYSPSNLECDSDSCSLDFTAQGYQASYEVSALGILGREFRSEENEDVFINYVTHKKVESNQMQMTFSCRFNNLSENADIYSDKAEMFYVMTIDCISEFESTLFDYRN